MKEKLNLFKKKRLFLLLLAPIAYFLNLFSASNPDWTEKYYSLGFYKYYSIIVSKITGIFPFSVGEILLVLSALSVVIFLVISVVKCIKNKKVKPILTYVMNLTVFASFVYFIFIIACGVNYNRYSFTYYYGDTARDYTVEELQDMCETLILTAGEIREELDDDDLARTGISYSEIQELSEMTLTAMEALEETYPVLTSGYGEPKSVVLSTLMSCIEITGVYFPWTVEANVNTAVPYYKIAYTMLHEQAHQRGFMSEDEANFIAWLAGKNSEDNIVLYSTYMSASVYAMNSLYKVDYDAFCEAYQLYTEGQIADKVANAEYWEQFEGEVSDTWTQVNDTYLKANGVEDGVISYDMVTELLLMDFYGG